MKNVSVNQLIEFAKVTKSIAIELAYSNLHVTKKVYTNHGNNARATMNWLVKNFGVNFTTGNDAPRGGKHGNYVTFESNEKFEKFAQSLIELDEKLENEQVAKKAAKNNALEAMLISEIEKSEYLAKVEGLSNKKARKVAHKQAAKKLGFFSTEGMKKFFELK